MSLLTDNVWPLIWCIALACLLLAIASYATGRGRLLQAIGGLAGLAALLLAIEWLVVSDRERIDAAIDDLADAVRTEEIHRIAPHLSPQCRYGNLGRDAVVRAAEDVLRGIQIDRITLNGRKTEVFPRRKEATAEFVAVTRGQQNNLEFGPYPTRWLLTFHQEKNGEWLIVEIQQLPTIGDNQAPLAPPGRVGK